MKNYERMIYPLSSFSAFHLDLFQKKLLLKKEDLSGIKKVQYGYTVLFDRNKKVTLFNSEFTRGKTFKK